MASARSQAKITDCLQPKSSPKKLKEPSHEQEEEGVVFLSEPVVPSQEGGGSTSSAFGAPTAINKKKVCALREDVMASAASSSNGNSKCSKDESQLTLFKQAVKVGKTSPDAVHEDRTLTPLMGSFSKEGCFDDFEVVPRSMTHPGGSIHGMAFSHGGTMLATCDTHGEIRVWDTEHWELVQSMRDRNEENIEEFYHVSWSPTDTKVLATGKLKDRNNWDQNDDDNQIMPCPIKVFDVLSGDVEAKHEGHSEEILQLKQIDMDGVHCLATCSQDGFIMKWEMKTQESLYCNRKAYMKGFDADIIVCIEFIPNTAHRYLLASADGNVALFDFQSERHIQTFFGIYSSFVDDIVSLRRAPFPVKQNEFLFLLRGVELVDETDTAKPMKNNSCSVHKLVAPSSHTRLWDFQPIRTYQHSDYLSNLWPCGVATDGHVVLAPTQDGKLVVWNMEDGAFIASQSFHSAVPRQLLFHPNQPLLATCGDDCTVRVTVKKSEAS